MPRRTKRRKAQRQRRKKPPPRKPRLVTYEFTNPALEGGFTIELPAGWRGGLKLSRGKRKSRR
jgi:hypothetical protein